MNAQCGFAQEQPQKKLSVKFTALSLQELKLLGPEVPKDIEQLIKETLSLDPRPAYHLEQKNNDREYGIRLYDYNIRWRVQSGCAEVISIQKTNNSQP